LKKSPHPVISSPLGAGWAERSELERSDGSRSGAQPAPSGSSRSPSQAAAHLFLFVSGRHPGEPVTLQ